MSELVKSGGKLKKWLMFAAQLLIGLALFGLLLSLDDFSSLRQLSNLRVLPLIAAFLCTIAIAMSVGGRWGVLVKALSEHPVVDWARFPHYFLWNRLFGFFVPKDLTDLGGRAMALVTRHGISLGNATLSVFIDRAFDLLVMLLFLGPAVLFLSNVLAAFWSGVLMVAIAGGFYLILRLFHEALILFASRSVNSLLDFAYRLPVLRRRSKKVLADLDLPFCVLQRAYLFSITKFLSTALRWVFFSLALSIPVPAHVFLFGTPVGQLSFLFAFTPGGLGIFELGWYAILMQAGLAETYISPLLVEQRVFTIVFVGVAALLSSVLNLLRSA